MRSEKREERLCPSSLPFPRRRESSSPVLDVPLHGNGNDADQRTYNSRTRGSKDTCAHVRSSLLIFSLLASLLLSACAASRCPDIPTLGNLGPEVNSPEDDVAPQLPDSTMLLFTSNRHDPEEPHGLRERAAHIESFWYTMRLEGAWDAPQPYPLALDNAPAPPVSLTLLPVASPLGVRGFVGTGDRGSDRGNLYALTSSSAGDGLVEMGGEVNSAGWEGSPSLSSDGRRLYFASDRPGGLGGSDIWYLELGPNGTWGTPRNAGPAINTAGDELSPFFDAATSTLYLSASTPDAGFDIMSYTEGTGGRRRLGAPYNSDADEITPWIATGKLYLASRRPGGCGGFDLYAFPISSR